MYLVAIEPSEFELQLGEKRKTNVICQVPQRKEEQYYARVVLEIDSAHEKKAGLDVNRGATKELSAVSQRFKEIVSNLDKPLEFMITFKKPGKASRICLPKGNQGS